MKKMQDYSAYLRSKGLQPIVIEKTTKKAGDIVLTSSSKPVEIVKWN